MANLRIQVVSTETEFAALGDQWQLLAKQDEQATLFNDWQWNSLWWQHYKHMGELYVLLVFDDQQLVGIGPFYRNRSTAMCLGKLNTLRFIGTGADTSPDDVNILAHPSVRKEVVNALCDHLFTANFQRMLFMEVAESSLFYSEFSTRANTLPGYAVTPVTHTRRSAELPSDWAKYRLQLSRNTHKQIKRRQNRLDATANAQFKLCRTQEEVDVAYNALVRLHVARWQTQGHSGSFGSDTYRHFHQALVRELLLRDQLWLVTLEVDGVIVAVEYSFLYKQTLMFFQTGYNLDYEHLSPGHLLITFAIKKAIENGVKRIDMLKGDYEYKTSYANEELRSANLGFYAQGLYSFVAKINDRRLKLKSA